MNKENNLLEISNLIDVYGNLLTEKQLIYIKMYYFDDLSLNEIAEEFKVTKNAVYDSINKTINNLKEIDSKLNVIQKRDQRAKIYSKIDNEELKKELLKIDGLI